MSAEHLIEAARRLLEDPLFVKALETVSRNAMGALVTADADDKTAILRFQAKVQVCDEVVSELEAAILAATAQEQQPVP